MSDLVFMTVPEESWGGMVNTPQAWTLAAAEGFYLGPIPCLAASHALQ